MAVNDVYRLTVVVGREDFPATAVNQFYFKQLTTLVFDTPGEDLVARFQAFCEPDYRNLWTNFLVMRRYSVGKAPNFETEHEFVFTTTVSGSETGEPLPPRNAALISYRTANLTKRGRGRSYVPPSVESSNGNGKPTSAYLTKMNIFGNDLLVDMQSTDLLYANWELQMWSKADQVARPVTQVIARPSWASQRDRKGLY